MIRRRSRDEGRAILRRFVGYLLPYKGDFLLIFLLLIFISVMQLVQPYLVGRLIDTVKVGASERLVVELLLIFAGSIVLRSLALLWRNYVLQRSGMRVTCDIRKEIFAHLQTLSLRFYEGRQTGKIVARVTTDTDSAHVLVTHASINLVGDAVTVVGALVFLLIQHVGLAIATYTVLPFFLLNYVWHRRRLRLESRRHRRNWDRVIGFLNERVSSARLVRAFAAEQTEIRSFASRIEDDYANYNKVVWRNTLLGVGAEAISGVGSLVVLGYGSWLALRGQDGFTVGMLASFMLYLGFLYAPIVRIVEANAIIQRALTALEKIFTLLDTQPHVPNNAKLPSLPALQGRVEFDKVSFAYRTLQPTLSDISFTIEPGEMVALVGPSGAGKSTLISLLARFYDATSGIIRVDGHDIRDFNTESLRRQIGIVMQDNVLFSGSLEENIKYGRPSATHEEMVAAAQAANAHEFISQLSNGYKSEVGERGVQLSGGQRQRVAIARVILKDPRLLIFDEATSALDTHSERLIQEAMERLMVNRTTLVIAHRLSTVIGANKIIVMQAGRIVEVGTHGMLLAQGGLYAKLHAMQFAEAPVH